jgi:hypothetical protein
MRMIRNEWVGRIVIITKGHKRSQKVAKGRNRNRINIYCMKLPQRYRQETRVTHWFQKIILEIETTIKNVLLSINHCNIFVTLFAYKQISRLKKLSRFFWQEGWELYSKRFYKFMVLLYILCISVFISLLRSRLNVCQ